MTTDLPESVFILPDPLAEWPWKRNINPLYLQVKAESSAWIRSFVQITPPVQRAFDLCECGELHMLTCEKIVSIVLSPELLASLAYPLENKDVLRAGCDFMNLTALFDEYTDTFTPSETQQLVTIVMDAIRNPDKARPAGECVAGEVTRQFWSSSSKCASEGARRRFIEAFDEWTTSVVQQTQDRTQRLIRNTEDYILVRRKTGGVKPSFSILEFGLNLPDEVFENTVIQRLIVACNDIIILINDMYSYNVEQARGDDTHNIVTILMHHQNVGLNEALKLIGDHCSKRAHEFLSDLRIVPFFGQEIQKEVECYLDGLANWVRANDSWSFESRRYFIAGGSEIQRSRKVVLLPRLWSDFQTK